jgi:hypothetical protein
MRASDTLTWRVVSPGFARGDDVFELGDRLGLAAGVEVEPGAERPEDLDVLLLSIKGVISSRAAASPRT